MAAAGQEIAARMAAVDDRLVPEMARGADGGNRLIISGDGIREAAPAVRRLAAAAPHIPGWSVIAFRQPAPLSADTSLALGAVELVVGDIWVLPSRAGGRRGNLIDLIVALPATRETERETAKHIAFLLLDHSIGERTMVEQIGFIDFITVPPNPARRGMARLDRLPEQLTALIT